MKISLNQKIVIGAVGGASLGLILNQLGGADHPKAYWILYISTIIGSIFIGLLKMILIPLIFTSITTGVANLRAHAQMGKILRLTLLYFLSTTMLAIALGLIAVNIFQPGKGLAINLLPNAQGQSQAANLTQMTLPEFIQNFVNNLFMNPVTAMANSEVLATVIFALFVGTALIAQPHKTQNVFNLLRELFDIIMIIVNWIMQIAPYGIAALLIKLVATQDLALFGSLGKFVLLVLGATLIHGFITLPLILYLIGKFSPLVFFKGMREALITAFSTSSSSATLPVTMRCAEENLKVDKNIAGFVLPVGATMNMDGTALYEAVAAVFVANIVGIELSLIQQLIVFAMAMLASIGAPGIPSAGMVTMIMVLQSVGLPAEAIAILLPMDRLLDTVRTMINVEGDAVGSVVIHRLTRCASTKA